MAEMGTDTASNQAGTEQQVVEREDGTASGAEAGEQSEAQKAAAAAEEERKVSKASPEEEVRKLSPKAQAHINNKINKLTGETKAERELRYKTEIENAELRGRIEGMKERPGAEKQPDPDARPARPKQDDFETVSDYNNAVMDYADNVASWNAKQVEKANEEKLKGLRASTIPAETLEQKQVRETKEKVGVTLNRLEAEFGSDAVETLTNMNQKQFSDSMRDIVIAKPDASSIKILGFLAENPQASEKIAAMPVYDQVREIDKLEASINAKKTTSAPAPVTTVSGKVAGGKIDESKMSDAEWAAHRRQQKISSA